MTADEKAARRNRLGYEEALAALPDGGGVAGSVASLNSGGGGGGAGAGAAASLAGSPFTGDVTAVGGGGGGDVSGGTPSTEKQMRWW